MASIIPYLHFIHPDKKLTAEWGNMAVNYYWFNSNNKNLLEGKNVPQILEYATGDIKMGPFMRMFRSVAKKLDEQTRANNPDMPINFDSTSVMEPKPLALIPEKLDSVIALIQKIPVEVACTANDALAMKKRNEDIVFLMNKPILEEDLQDIAEQLQMDKVDLGTTKHSSSPLAANPFGMDLSQPDQREIFMKLMYSLAVETSFEIVLQQLHDLKKAEQIRLLETKDQYYYGVSTNTAYTSSITGLPDLDYEYPGNVTTQESDLPDFSDNQARFIDKRMSVLDMFNMFSDEIGGEDKLEEIINGSKTGYCDCNKFGNINSKFFGSFKVNLVKCEVKSLDWVGIYKRPKSKRGAMELTMDEKLASEKIWAQNTYSFWWLKNTKYIFGIQRLDYTHRSRGQESFQNFSTNIYRSKKKSAVELSIGENIKAMIAEIKLQHVIITSLPPGIVIDLKGMRNAIRGMVKDNNNRYTIESLITLAREQNVHLIDTEGFDGPQDGQLKPFYEIPGGLRTEANGYIQIIQQCAANISKFTGINEALTGQSVNPDMLVGLEKLRMNASINSQHYVNKAIETQYQAVMNVWANLVQYAIEKGGKTKEGIINFIGIDDVNILDGLNETPLHNLTIKVSLTQREEERQEYKQRLQILIEQGSLSVADQYMLDAIKNPKERLRFLAIKEAMYKKEKKQEQERAYQANSEMQDKRNEGMIAAMNAKAEGEQKKIYTKGMVDAKRMELASKLGIQANQVDFIAKRALQQDRGQDQQRKAEAVIEKKKEADLQQPLPIV